MDHGPGQEVLGQVLLGICLPGPIDPCRGDHHQVLNVPLVHHLGPLVEDALGLASTHLCQQGEGRPTSHQGQGLLLVLPARQAGGVAHVQPNPIASFNALQRCSRLLTTILYGPSGE